MSDNTRIEYVDASWNPIRGCDMSLPCAARCWARRMAHRQASLPGYEGFTDERGHWTGKVALIEKQLAMPFRWCKPRRVAVSFMGDLFHPNLPDEDIWNVFRIMRIASDHTYLVLTKRPQRMRDLLLPRRWRNLGRGVTPGETYYVPIIPGEHRPDDSSFLPHILLGVSVSSQADADKRREPMKALAALGWNTWCSYEPALGPADWRGWEFLSWLVTGGESGPEARPMHPDWARAARDFAIGNKIPLFFKQWGEWLPVYDAGVKDYGCEVHTFGDQDYIRVGKKAAGSLLDGQRWEQVPGVLRCPA